MKKSLTESFRKTGIREYRVEVEHTYPWVSIHLPQLDCEQMMSLSKWIRETFSQEGKYSHLLPKIGLRLGSFCLVISREQCIEKFGELV